MIPPRSLRASLLACLAGSALAQEAPPRPASLTRLGALAGVHLDQPGDGNVWALAPGYKMRFGADAIDYHPYLGPKAPSNFPIRFRVASVRAGETELPLTGEAQPTVAGSRVTIDRGAVREVWDLHDRDAEQSFVLEKPDGRGDLVVTLSVTTELQCDDAGAGLRFVIPGLGEVRYGDVVAFDATSSARSESVWRDGAIELRVPAAFVAAARGPITIDPLVATIAIDAGNDDTLDPDVAYEPTTDRWLVVYERVFSANDIDIISRRYSGTGSFIEEVVVATGTRESLNPAVAANRSGQQFLVVWDEDRTLDRIILGRTRAAGSTTQGAQFTVRDASGVRDQNPAVGGSAATDTEGNRYLVVCEEGDTDVAVVTVTTAGAPTSVGFTIPPNNARRPAVTRARQTNVPWLVAYESSGSVFVDAVHASGSGIVRTRVNNSGAASSPVVAGNGHDFLVVYENRTANGTHDLHAALVQFSINQFIVGTLFNLTAGEPGAVLASDQKDPAVSWDGLRFTYAYLESSGGGNYEPYAATVFFNDNLTGFSYSDAHRLLVGAATAQAEGNMVLASMGEIGGDAARNFAVFDRQIAAANHDVAGALYDGVVPGTGLTTAQTGCGGSFEPAITIGQVPALGANVQIDVTRFAPAGTLMFFGPPAAPVTVCPAGCQLGVLPFLVVISGVTSVTIPVPRDRALIGGQLAVQAMIVGVPFGCGAPQFPVSFVMTDTITMTFG